jgi:hypothetical protein
MLDVDLTSTFADSTSVSRVSKFEIKLSVHNQYLMMEKMALGGRDQPEQNSMSCSIQYEQFDNQIHLPICGAQRLQTLEALISISLVT